MVGYLVGLLFGGLVLGALLLAAGVAASRLDVSLPTAVLLFAVPLLVADVVGWRDHLALNFRVPAPWVGPGGARAGVTWGVFLGAGFVTESPYLGLHAVLAAAAITGRPLVVVATMAGFLIGRAVVLLPSVRRRYGYDARYPDPDREVQAGIRARHWGQGLSRVSLMLLVGIGVLAALV